MELSRHVLTPESGVGGIPARDSLEGRATIMSQHNALPLFKHTLLIGIIVIIFSINKFNGRFRSGSTIIAGRVSIMASTCEKLQPAYPVQRRSITFIVFRSWIFSLSDLYGLK